MYSIISVYAYTVFGLTLVSFTDINLFQEVNDGIQFIVLVGGAISLIMTIWFNIKNWRIKKTTIELEKKIKEQELEKLEWENDQHEKEHINTLTPKDETKL